MPNKQKILLLNYGIPRVATVVIAIQLFFVNTQSRTK
jgi:hypothetical protein